MRNTNEIGVFIADDSPSMRKLISSLITEIDGVAIVGEADNPSEAIKGIVMTHPDSVVLDAFLKSGRGIEVLRGARASVPGAVFIVMSNHPDPQYRKVYLNAGASYFLDKSNEFEKIVEIISGLRRTHH